MKLGKIKYSFIFIVLIFCTNLKAEDKIISAPIINLENLEPSYEALENEKDTASQSNTKIKKRNKIEKKSKNIKFVNLIGLDKITAKTIPIKIKLGKLLNLVYLKLKR